MSARAEIFTNKHDILKEKGTVADSTLVDHLFENFMQYASANWSYSASAPGQTVADLLSTSGGKTVACDTLAGAFTRLIKEADEKLIPEGKSKNWFITRPDLKCFDGKVTGNMGNPDAVIYNLGCHFSAHFFTKFGDKFYDPCLSTTYTKEDGAVLMETRLVAGTNNLRYAGIGRTVILLKPKQKVIPGFGSVVVVLSIYKDDIKKWLDKGEYEAVKKMPLFHAAGLK